MHAQLVVLFHIVDPGNPSSLFKIFNNNSILFHLRIPPSGEIYHSMAMAGPAGRSKL